MGNIIIIHKKREYMNDIYRVLAPLFVITGFFWSGDVTAQEMRFSTKAEIYIELQKYTFKELKNILQQQIRMLDEIHSSSDISTSSSVDGYQTKYIERFEPPTQTEVNEQFNVYLNELEFSQNIKNNVSYINTTFNESRLLQQVKHYKKFEYAPPQIEIKKVTFSDGTSTTALYNAPEDRNTKKVNTTKTVTSLTLQVSYFVPREIKSYTFSLNEKKHSSTDNIKLLTLSGSEAVFTMPENLPDKLLYVEANDNSGKALEATGTSTSYNDNYYVHQLRSVFSNTLKRMENNELSNQKEALNFLLNHYPVQEEVHKTHPPRYLVKYKFKGNIEQVTFFFRPGYKQIKQTITLNRVG